MKPALGSDMFTWPLPGYSLVWGDRSFRRTKRLIIGNAHRRQSTQVLAIDDHGASYENRHLLLLILHRRVKNNTTSIQHKTLFPQRIFPNRLNDVGPSIRFGTSLRFSATSGTYYSVCMRLRLAKAAFECTMARPLIETPMQASKTAADTTIPLYGGHCLIWIDLVIEFFLLNRDLTCVSRL